VSALVERLVRVFVEPPAAEGPAPAAPPAALAAPGRPPTVAVLGRTPQPAAAIVALALVRACGARCALVAGVARPPSPLALPAARRAAARLREHGVDAIAAGRLVLLVGAPAGEDDPVGAAAAASAALGRAASLAGVPGTLAIPLARSDALDRVLRWHDALVAVRMPDADELLARRALASLAQLGRPVVALASPGRQAEALARLGLWTPTAAPDLVRLGEELAEATGS